MKRKLLSCWLAGCLAFTGAARAQVPEAKSGETNVSGRNAAAEQALLQFNQECRAVGGRDEARLQRVIAAGMAFLATHARHRRANDVVEALAFYPRSFGPTEAALRTSYLAQLKLAVAELRRAEGAEEATMAAAAAMEAAMLDHEVRDAFSGEGLARYRQQLDALARTPGTARFLVPRERSYVQMLAYTAPSQAEAVLKTMLTHRNRAVAAMARAELNLVEVKKEPFSLAFTGFDGRPVELAQWRGKVVALYFWSSTHKASLGHFKTLKQVYAAYRKRGFEVVTVACDKPEDREKVGAALKANRIGWPVHFDGRGTKADFAAKLNLTGVPALLIFDQKGMLQHTMQGSTLTINLPVHQLEGQVKHLLGLK